METGDLVVDRKKIRKTSAAGDGIPPAGAGIRAAAGGGSRTAAGGGIRVAGGVIRPRLRLCKKEDCPFCLRPNCGVCCNCKDPSLKNKCLQRYGAGEIQFLKNDVINVFRLVRYPGTVHFHIINRWKLSVATHYGTVVRCYLGIFLNYFAG